MGKKLDITGLRFGRLIAIKKNGFHQSPSRKHILWECKCDCGNVITTKLNTLRNGNVKSCGCLHKEGNNKTHNQSKTREYNIWGSIKQRCLNKNHSDYINYGGRGITICNEWIDSFETFIKDMGNCPIGFSIDRIDNSKGYSKENCRWANNYMQSRNKRNNRYYELNGKIQVLQDWANDLGISFSTICERLEKWDLEKALTTFNMKEN